MKPSSPEFRLRFLLYVLVYVLGFWAPWDIWVHLDGTGPNAHVWGVLSALLAKSGAIGIGRAFDLLLILGIACALVAAWLRTWAAAYPGVRVVRDSMPGEAVMADGPYRHVRNPSYLGTLVHTLGLALLMPPSGAAFCIVAIFLLEVRLILVEENFLAARLGAAYLAYCARVPRLLPAARARVMRTGARPRWAQAVVGEIYMWGVAVSFAVLGWRYNALLLTKCVLVSLGISLVARAFVVGEKASG